ncbi:uncharacterized protein LOC109949123 [Prunus persica]|uniref:uncharacterized protein LOC109949123 n=1 Tax=Prunus persica TaxID=3760 RepID=UPI0009AB9C83|nr:uncharacterized protein LOC109949123 [Prunus persica]
MSHIQRARAYSPYPSLESRSFSKRCPSCPPEVVVKYPDGVRKVVRRSDFHKTKFPKSDGKDVDPNAPDCKSWVELAVEATLFEGSDSYYSEYFCKHLMKYCGGIEIDFGKSKKGSTSTSKVQD